MLKMSNKHLNIEGAYRRLDSINSDQDLYKKAHRLPVAGKSKFPRSALSVSSITRSHDHT